MSLWLRTPVPWVNDPVSKNVETSRWSLSAFLWTITFATVRSPAMGSTRELDGFRVRRMGRQLAGAAASPN